MHEHIVWLWYKFRMLEQTMCLLVVVFLALPRHGAWSACPVAAVAIALQEHGVEDPKDIGLLCFASGVVERSFPTGILKSDDDTQVAVLRSGTIAAGQGRRGVVDCFTLNATRATTGEGGIACYPFFRLVADPARESQLPCLCQSGARCGLCQLARAHDPPSLCVGT